MTFDTGDSRESPDNTPARETLCVTLCSRIFVEVHHARGPSFEGVLSFEGELVEELEHELAFKTRRVYTGFFFVDAVVTLVVQRHNLAGWTLVA